MDMSNEVNGDNNANNHVAGGAVAAWAADGDAATGCIPRSASSFRKGTVRILVVSPSCFVRIALVQRLSDIVSPRVQLILADDIADAADEAYDLIVVGPYLSEDERAQAAQLHAGRSGVALIELADSHDAGCMRVVRSDRRSIGALTDVVSAALLSPSPTHVSTGGTDA